MSILDVKDEINILNSKLFFLSSAISYLNNDFKFNEDEKLGLSFILDEINEKLKQCEEAIE